jgi:hypothetical protein
MNSMPASLYEQVHQTLVCLLEGLPQLSVLNLVGYGFGVETATVEQLSTLDTPAGAA